MSLAEFRARAPSVASRIVISHPAAIIAPPGESALRSLALDLLVALLILVTTAALLEWLIRRRERRP